MLLRDGHVTRSALGVGLSRREVRQLSEEDRQALKLRPGENSGAAIEYVAPGGPADQAGLQPGDIILALDQQPIAARAQLQWLASTAGVGRTVTLRVQRLGKQFDVKLTLAQLREEPLQQRPR